MGSSEEFAFRGLTNWRAPTDKEIQRGIDATMRDVVSRDARHNPHAFAPQAGVAPLSEDAILSKVFDGAFSVEQAKNLKARIKQLPEQARAALIQRLGQMNKRELYDELIEAEGGLTRAQREEWEREQRSGAK